MAQERPTKRQVAPVFHGTDITGASSTPRNDEISPLPSTQAVHWSPSDFDSMDSGTPLPRTPGPADEVCFGMVANSKNLGSILSLTIDRSVALRHSSLMTRASQPFVPMSQA